jgi:hypothetical protein
MRGVFVCFALLMVSAGCGGKSEEDGTNVGRLSDTELSTAIENEIDDLNSCTGVEDCVAVRYPACGTVYTGAGGDHTRLDSLLAEHRQRAGKYTLACDDSCQCGVLRCEAGRCATSQSDCVTTLPDERQVCL